MRSLQSILNEMDDQYERQRQDLIATLPTSHVKDRRSTLEARHRQRRENDSRETTALLESVGAAPGPDRRVANAKA